ncbi:hypothetical protein J6590_092082 [Homalodisca vitripennis]|nr:hypothetical protein J6590_092082 [Homalodisca vitripennis]
MNRHNMRFGASQNLTGCTESPRAKLGYRSFYDVNDLLMLQTESPRAKLGYRSFYDVNDAHATDRAT